MRDPSIEVRHLGRAERQRQVVPVRGHALAILLMISLGNQGPRAKRILPWG